MTCSDIYVYDARRWTWIRLRQSRKTKAFFATEILKMSKLADSKINQFQQIMWGFVQPVKRKVCLLQQH